MKTERSAHKDIYILYAGSNVRKLGYYIELIQASHR